MSRPRIVVDTSVLISAALKPQSLPALVVNLVAFEAMELCVSRAVLAEYREVFIRTKFAHVPSADVANLLAMIERAAIMVMPPNP